MRKIDVIDYEVDQAMLGSDWDDEIDDFDLFCDILQHEIKKKCLFFNVVSITDSWNGATHKYEDPEYDTWRYEHLGDFPRYEFIWDEIPWEEALDMYSLIMNERNAEEKPFFSIEKIFKLGKLSLKNKGLRFDDLEEFNK